MSTGSTVTRVARAFDRVAAGVCEQAAAFGGGAPRAELTSPLDAAQAQLYAAAIASSNHAFFSVDFDGMITAWNRGAERLFGHAAADAIGHHVSLIVPEDRRHEIAAILASVRRDQPADSSPAIDGLVTMLRKRLRNHGVHRTEH